MLHVEVLAAAGDPKLGLDAVRHLNVGVRPSENAVDLLVHHDFGHARMQVAQTENGPVEEVPSLVGSRMHAWMMAPYWYAQSNRSRRGLQT